MLTGSWFFFLPLFRQKGVRWKEHTVGRVLEVRFDWHGARTTVVAVYQHVWSPAKTVQANRQDRASVLKSLGRCVKQVPHRGTLIVAGDFNSSLSRQPRLAGPAVLVPQDKRPDESELANFLCSHRMVALYTWQAQPPHTFAQGETRTQIDFVLTREVSAGRQAKQAKLLTDFALGSWKKGGHLLVAATVAPIRHWHLPGPQIKPTRLRGSAGSCSIAVPAGTAYARMGTRAPRSGPPP